MEEMEFKTCNLLNKVNEDKGPSRNLRLKKTLRITSFIFILSFISLFFSYYQFREIALAKDLDKQNKVETSSNRKILTVEKTNIPITRYIDGNQNDWFIDFYKLDGKQAFCLDPAVSANTGMTYQSTTGDVYINKYVNRGDLPQRLSLAVYFGYNHNNFTKNPRMNKAFTQMLIWKMIIQDNEDFRNSEGEKISYVGFTDKELRKAFDDFQAKVKGEINKALNLKPSFDGKSYSLEQGKSLSIRDNKGVLKDLKFKLNNSTRLKTNGISLNIVGNVVKIQADIKADLTKISKIDMVYREINPKTMGGINLFYANSGSKGQKMGILDQVAPNIATITIKPVKRPVKNGRIRITKVIGKDKKLCEELKDLYKLDGARFSIRDAKGKLVETLEYKDGKIPLSRELKPGKYMIEETRMPTSKAFINVVGKLKAKTIIVEEGKTSYVQFKNTPKFDPILVLLRKYNEKDQLLAGAKFRISYFKDNSINSPWQAKKVKADRTWIWKTNKYGSINMSLDKPLAGSSPLYRDDANRPVFLPGSYLFEEVEPPAGYLASEPLVYHMDVDKINGKYQSWNVKKFVNRKIKGRIRLVKTDDSKEKRPVEGAVFGIYKCEDNRLVDKIKTNFRGLAFSNNLDYGKYYLRELSADKKYELDSDKHMFEIKTNEEILELRSINKLYGVKLKLVKLDKNSKKKLPGAIFELVNDKGEKLETLITNDEGIAISANKLLLGKYKIIEKKAPRGYIRGKDIDFEVKRDSETIEIGEKAERAIEKRIENEPSYHKIIKKSLNDKRILEGAKLLLRNKRTKKLIRKWTSKKEAEIFMGLEVGQTYEILEEKAPRGYIRNKSLLEFTVENTDKEVEHEVFNEKKPEISTKAKLNMPGIRSLKKIVQIADKISYKDLIVGKTYRIEGSLMDKASKKPLKIKGKYLTSTLTFKARKRSGEITMIYDLPLDDLPEKTLVVFEDLYRGDDLVASHRDMEDPHQTVRFERNIDKTKYKRPENPKTHDIDIKKMEFLVGVYLMGLVGLGILKKDKK